MRRGVALGVALEPPWTSTSMSADAQQLDAGSTKALQKNKLLRPRFFRVPQSPRFRTLYHLRCTAMQEEAPSTTIPASRPKRCFSIVMTWENSHGRAATDSISPDWVSSSIGLAPTILPFGPMEDGRWKNNGQRCERPSLLQPTSHLWFLLVKQNRFLTHILVRSRAWPRVLGRLQKPAWPMPCRPHPLPFLS
ncbi:hypothetical protein CABS01_14336 [Colletotrichum abscissum]|uniref:uncharacterized protein n=1 Tax=Colletotrichum abscissum TaxID=1671311 RepID=UPI0027D5F3CB|nr:uncharacterized protein CABS01_14336 [Colletotrichum abscissum]KAK1480810.1 hypothetical protein CABS01_14336 [Colletotrichum abscissum]